VSAPTVGVCFEDQLVDVMPLAPHDVRVGAVVTA
jgi:5-formyltetrahydrofolate cyclo-ligase